MPPAPPHPPDRRPWAAVVVLTAFVAALAALVAVVASGGPRARPAGPPSGASTPSGTRTPSGTSTPAGTETTTSSAPGAAARDGRPPAVPTAERPLRLWVGGDSLAAGPSWAVFLEATATGVIAPLAEYQVGTGLVRREFWDWPKHMKAVVRARDPRVTVFMMGANDDQGIEIDGVSYQPPAAEWTTEYRRRVDRVMRTLTAAGRHLVWIGMPPMRDPEYSAAMGLVSQIAAEQAGEHRRVTYVDAWSLFSAPGAPGTYAQSLPDESGNLTNMRLDDGIHLNVEGSQYLARVVMSEVGKLVTLPPS